MTLTPRIFRLFVSSTFSDFIAEREALQKSVFPELEKYCAKGGARFQAVDLRWGITEEAQREHDTMRICLEEVRRCQQLSPRPNFAVLLGDRYGWEPVPARIPQEHWKRLIKAASEADRELIEANYRLDENAIPAVHCLRQRMQEQDAFQREANLLQALRRAASGFRGRARLPYFASATHQEIVLGALSRRDEQRIALNPDQHVHVYVRHIEGLPHNESAQDFIDWDANKAEVVPGAKERLRGLEGQLRRQLGDHVHDLHTTWSRHGSNGSVNKAYLKRFCDDFLSHQKALIDAELASLEQTDERQQREQAHRVFGAERARVFAGRKTLLGRIARYTASGPNPKYKRSTKSKRPTVPLILLGGGGSGKSALLARAVQETIHQAKRSGAIVLQRYIGGVPGTESVMTTVTALTADIASRYGEPEPSVAENAKELAENFRVALGHASAKRPLTIYLDALDQLEPSNSAWMLEWLPKELPEHVRVVASARKGTSVEQSARRRYPQSLIEVPVMKPTEGRAMLKAWLADKRAAWFNAGVAPSIGRRLTKQQEQAVLAAFNYTGSALWLKLAYDEAATWASWDAPRQLSSTVQGLIEDLIDHRLIRQENHPKVFTERALAYLTAGRFGLSESELGRTLGTDKAVRAEFQANEKTKRKWEDKKLLPPILWSRLYFDLHAYLGLAQMDGALLMRWFHREFAEVLKGRYLGSEEDRQAIHGTLADTFLQLERELRSLETNDDTLFRATDASGKQVSAALRRVMEQPWQLAQAGRQEDLEALLTEFGFCLGKSAANRVEELTKEIQGLASMGQRLPALRDWYDFWRQQRHVLCRGDAKWPSHRIFLQLAAEESDDSTITQEAEAWLRRGHCDWVWVRNRSRPKQKTRSPLLAVMEGHSNWVSGAQAFDDGRLLSWSEDSTLRLWDSQTGELLAVMEGHTKAICGARILADGRVLSWSDDETLRLWDGQTGEPLTMMQGHTDSVTGVEILSDSRLLSRSSDGTLRLWNGQTGEPLAVMQGHGGSIDGAKVLPGGQVLSWSADGTLRLWDGQTGAPRAVMKGHTKSVVVSELLSDGRVLSSSWDRTLRLWDLQTGAQLAVMEGHTNLVSYAELLSDGRVLSYSWDQTLRLWNGQTGAALAVMKGDSSPLDGARVLPDGRALSWSLDGTLRLWDLHTGKPIVVMEGHTNRVLGIEVLPDGRLLSRSDDHTLRLWDGCTGVPLAVMRGHDSYVGGVRVLHDGRLLSWAFDGTLLLWDGTGALVATMQGHTSLVRAVHDLSDGRVLSWSFDETLRMWDTHTALLPVERKARAEPVDGACALHDGTVLSWSFNGTLGLWDGWSGKLRSVMQGHTDRIKNASVLPDGRVFSRSQDKTLRLWNGQTGEPLAVMQGHTKAIDGARILADGRVLSWSADSTLRLWDANTGMPLAVLKGHTSSIKDAQVLPDGRVLSWSADSTLRLWDANTGMPLAVLKGHASSVSGAQVLLDGRVLSWSHDGTLRLWDADTGAPLAVMQGHTGWVGGVRALSDARVLSWSNDGTLRLWDADTSAPLAVMQGHTGWVDGARALFDGRVFSWSRDGTLHLWDGETGEPLAVMRGHAPDKHGLSAILGVEVLPDGQLLSWSADDVRLWEGRDGQSLRELDQPWVDSAQFPVTWDRLDRTAGAQRFGEVWVQDSKRGIAFAERSGAWKARWHGSESYLIGISAGSILVTSSRNLMWLQVLDGVKPISIEATRSLRGVTRAAS